MRLLAIVLPNPFLSLTLLIIWVLLVNSVSPGQLLLGSVMALLVPGLINQFFPQNIFFRRPLRAARFLLMVLWDIVVANVVVARWVLGPAQKLQPAFIELPVELSNDYAITVFASTISLAPGTVCIDFDKNRQLLLIHCLNVRDEQALIKKIKVRYEQPIKEIFECSTS